MISVDDEDVHSFEFASAKKKPSFSMPVKGHKSSSSISTSISDSTPVPKKTARSSNTQPQAKRSRTEAFADKNKVHTEVLGNLAQHRHEHKMQELSYRKQEMMYKRQKLEVMGQKETLAAEQKCLAVQHQRKREKEEHELRILKMRLEFSNHGGLPGTFGGGAGAPFTFGNNTQPTFPPLPDLVGKTFGLQDVPMLPNNINNYGLPNV